jgi:hypothetical protein
MSQMVSQYSFEYYESDFDFQLGSLVVDCWVSRLLL